MMGLGLQRTIRREPLAAALLAAFLLVPGAARGQDAGLWETTSEQAPATAAEELAGEQAPASYEQQPMLDESIEAAETEGPEPRRRMTAWNRYEGPRFTIKAGLALMYEYGAFSQDEASERQFGLIPNDYKWRDRRFSLEGTFPKRKRIVMWKAGFMYDGPSDSYFARETGLIVAVPEIKGHLFIGRTKEGFSLSKQMVGYAVWGFERAPINDATIPIMADGVRWMGYLPKKHVLWNLGLYNEKYSQSRHFPYQDRQAVARVAWLPYLSEESGTLLHVGLSLRYAEPQDGELQLRARPEAFLAPFYLDTGKFPADHTRMIGPEIYWRHGSWLIGSEYFFMKASAPQHGDPLFHGGDLLFSWLATGETRRYSTRGGIFGFVRVKRSVFEGGPGALEPILRISYTDLDDGPIQGGKLWRISSMLAWHLSDELRWTVGYGYGVLDRFDEKGSTQFFQTRIQLQF
jgi:phosphate-selective porin OprO and OprP